MIQQELKSTPIPYFYQSLENARFHLMRYYAKKTPQWACLAQYTHMNKNFPRKSEQKQSESQNDQ